MRKFLKGYFTTVQILDLILGIIMCVCTVLPIFSVITSSAMYVTIFHISGIFLFIIAGLLPTALILVIGILLIKASKKFKKARYMSDEELISAKGNLLGWGIFTAIILAPSLIGLVVMLVFVIIANNNISDLEHGEVEKVDRSFGQAVSDGAKATGTAIKNGAKSIVQGTKEVFGIKDQMQQQKELLMELKQWQEEGLLSEEEYKAKRAQILGI